METARYGMAERPNKERGSVTTRQKICRKHRIAAILGPCIIPAAVGTPGSAGDSIKLPTMLRKTRRRGFDVSGRLYNADGECDSDGNREELSRMHIIPNVRQRKYAETRDKPDRGKAAEMFGGVAYHMRGTI